MTNPKRGKGGSPQTSYASMIWFRFKGYFSAYAYTRTPLSRRNRH